MAAALAALPARRFVLDGEIVVPVERRLSFEALQLRLHPAESRVRKLAAEHPAVFVAFDLLAAARRVRAPRPAFRGAAARAGRLHRGQARQPRAAAVAEHRRSRRGARLAGRLGADIDGIIAKDADRPYLSGQRDGMQKYKPQRTADCVVGGFRYGRNTRLVGSLLLGLYGEEGLLHHVGFTATLPARDKPALTARLEQLVAPPGFTGRAPGGPSRWAPSAPASGNRCAPISSWRCATIT